MQNCCLRQVEVVSLCYRSNKAAILKLIQMSNTNTNKIATRKRKISYSEFLSLSDDSGFYFHSKCLKCNQRNGYLVYCYRSDLKLMHFINIEMHRDMHYISIITNPKDVVKNINKIFHIDTIRYKYNKTLKECVETEIATTYRYCNIKDILTALKDYFN